MINHQEWRVFFLKEKWELLKLGRGCFIGKKKKNKNEQIKRKMQWRKKREREGKENEGWKRKCENESVDNV